MMDNDIEDDPLMTLEREPDHVPPSLHAIDKQLALFRSEQRSARSEQRAFQVQVEKRFDGVDRKVDEFASAYAKKSELDALDAKFEKFRDACYAYVKFIILGVIAAVIGLVLNKTGLPH